MNELRDLLKQQADDFQSWKCPKCDKELRRGPKASASEFRKRICSHLTTEFNLGEGEECICSHIFPPYNKEAVQRRIKEFIAIQMMKGDK